jgi:hypothetical protein
MWSPGNTPVVGGIDSSTSKVGDDELASVIAEYGELATSTRWLTSTVGVRDNMISLPQAATLMVRLSQIVDSGGMPIADITNAYKKPITYPDGAQGYPNPQGLKHPRLTGVAGPPLANAHCRAWLVGDEARTVATISDAVTDDEGVLLLTVDAGTHVESIALHIDVVQNPVNRWFKPVIASRSLTFLPARNRDDSGVQLPYALRLSEPVNEGAHELAHEVLTEQKVSGRIGAWLARARQGAGRIARRAAGASTPQVAIPFDRSPLRTGKP